MEMMEMLEKVQVSLKGGKKMNFRRVQPGGEVF